MYAITKEYPGRMPWEDQAEKKKKKQSLNNARMAFIFHVHCPDEQQLATLLDRAKYHNLWYEHWGGVASTVEQPDFATPAGVKDRYIEMVQSYGVMQLSMEAATIPGIVTATRKFVLCLTPDKNGQPLEPTKKSLTDILRLMEIVDKKVCYVLPVRPTEFTQVISPAWLRKSKPTLWLSSNALRLRCATGSNPGVALAKMSIASYASTSQWSNNRR